MKQYRIDTDRMEKKYFEILKKDEIVKKKDRWPIKEWFAKFLGYKRNGIFVLKKKAPHIVNALMHYEEVTGDSMSNVIKEIPCVKKKK